MIRFKLLIVLALLFSFSHAGAITMEDALEQWNAFLDEQLWVIQKYEPILYTEILDGVQRDLENRVSKNELIFNIMKKQNILIEKYIVVSPLIILDQYHEMEILKMNFFIENGINECIHLLSENLTSVQAIKMLPFELVDNRKLFEQTILSKESGYKPDIDMAYGEQEYNTLIKSMLDQYGASFEKAIDNLDSIRSCEFINLLDKKIAKLSEAKRVHVLRYLYSP